eukprot:5502749-Amphidinium_carterae.1
MSTSSGTPLTFIGDKEYQEELNESRALAAIMKRFLMVGNTCERVFEGIVAPAQLYYPWNFIPSSRDAHSARNALCRAFRPSVDPRVPHSEEVYYALVFKTHIVDPIAARVYSLQW